MQLVFYCSCKNLQSLFYTLDTLLKSKHSVNFNGISYTFKNIPNALIKILSYSSHNSFQVKLQFCKCVYMTSRSTFPPHERKRIYISAIALHI